MPTKSLIDISTNICCCNKLFYQINDVKVVNNYITLILIKIVDPSMTEYRMNVSGKHTDYELDKYSVVRSLVGRSFLVPIEKT